MNQTILLKNDLKHSYILFKKATIDIQHFFLRKTTRPKQRKALQKLKIDNNLGNSTGDRSMLLGYLIYIIHIQREKSGQSSNRIESKHTDKNQYTPLSMIGGLHCPFSPLGPRIECLERVSSFGGGRVRDLQKVRKNARDLLVKQCLCQKMQDK